MSDSENRADHRRRVLKEGKIVTNHGHSTIDCLIRDISAGGARLKVENGVTVPATFELLLLSENAKAPAEVVWRKATEVGIRFAAAKSQAA